MKHIIDDKADIVNLNNEELYLAGRLYNLEPFAMEQYNGGECWPLFIVFFAARLGALPDPIGRTSLIDSLQSARRALVVVVVVVVGASPSARS